MRSKEIVTLCLKMSEFNNIFKHLRYFGSKNGVSFEGEALTLTTCAELIWAI